MHRASCRIFTGHWDLLGTSQHTLLVVSLLLSYLQPFKARNRKHPCISRKGSLSIPFIGYKKTFINMVGSIHRNSCVDILPENLLLLQPFWNIFRTSSIYEYL